MKTFFLKSRDGEVINKVDTNNLDNAIAIFAEIKKLTTKSLLEIYDVVH